MCKKRIVLSLILAMLFVSCKNPLNFKQDAKESQKAYISISANLPGSNARTVLPTVVTDTTTGLTWELTGEMIGSSTSKTFTKSWDDTEDKTAYQQMIYPDADSGILLDVGNWQFTLTVYNNEGKVLEATLGDENNPIQITKDGENKLKFVMQEATGENLANGQIEFTLKFPPNVVGQVEATLYEYPTSPNGENTNLDIQTRTDADGKSYSCVVYENSNDLASGYYKLNLALQQNTGTEEEPEYETITTYSCLIYVAPGLLSSGSYELTSLAKLYPVTFELNGGSLTGETTLTYNKYQTFTLPTPIPPSDDVEFGGWYKEEDFSTKIEGNYSLPDDVTDDGVKLYAKWERKLSLDNIFAIGDQDSTPDEVSEDNATYTYVENKYGILTIKNTVASSSVWDYYVRTNESVPFSQEKNYSVSVDLKSEGGDTVVGIQAAYADMFFTVGKDWKTYTFETGYLDKELPDGKNGITIGSALASEVYISNLVITEIQGDDELPTLAFNVTKTGIENYLNNADRPKNIIEVEKTESNDGYAITINTPLASNNYDSTNTYLYNDVTLELRDYAKNKGINKVAFDFQTSDTVYTSIVADTISPNSMAWNNKRQTEESLSTIFPVFEEGEEVTASIIKISNADVTSQNETSFSIRNFKIEKIDAYSNKYFAIKTPASTGGDKYTESQSVPVSEVITIPGNNASKEFDVLMYNKNDSGIDWDEVTRFIYSTEEKTIESLRYYIGDDGKYYIQNTGSSEISCRITLTEDFTVQIEDVTTTGGTTGEGATSESPSEQNRGLAYFTKTENNSNISCLYIYDEEGLGLYRDLVNGTLKSELTFTKNGYTIGSIPPSYTGRVDAYLAENIEITNAWTPIGTSSNSFTSSFDGQGHSITINSCADGEYAGVFGYVGNQSASTTSISNLVVKGQDAGITTSAQYAGGIVAYSYGATISNCVNKLKIDASASSTGYLGGIVGYTKKETIISSCANFAELVSTSSIGGIVGFADVENNYSPLSIDKCINIGSIKGSSNGNYVSGILGRTATATTISNCINFGERGCNGGPFPLNHSGVATVTDSGNLTISNCINAGPYANIYNSASIAIAYAVNTNSINSSNLYYNTDNWYYDYYGSQVQGNVEDTCTVRGLSTEDFFDSSKCVLVADENWSCVTDGTRYPLPNILGADENSGVSQSIWQEICYAAKVEVSSGGGEEEIIQNAYYVSAIGSDANDGKTTDTSFATLEHALSKITDEYRTIYIVGTYYGQNGAYNSATWIDTSVGTQESPIQIIGYPDSNPELSQNGEKRVLYISEDSYLILKNISIVGGNTSQTGGAICFDADGQLTLENCTLSGNESTSTISGFDSLYHNGITLSSNSSLIVKNSVIENNIVLDSASADSTSVTFTGSSEIKGNVILNSDSTNIILENDITVSGTIYIATGIIPEPAITITSALTKHSSDNKISVSYQDFTKALSTKCISLGEGVSSDEISKFMLTDESYVISTDGKISTNN